MKPRLPWHKRYHADFLHGVHGIGPDVIGCYEVILDMIYDRGGPIADDPRMIGAWLGCSPRKAKSLMNRLVGLGKLFRTPSGLSNVRAEAELTELCHLRDLMVENGAKGGRSRVERVKKRNDFNETGQALLKPGLSIARGLPDNNKNTNHQPPDCTPREIGKETQTHPGVVSSDFPQNAASGVVGSPNLPAAPPSETIIVTSGLLGTRLVRKAS